MDWRNRWKRCFVTKIVNVVKEMMKLVVSRTILGKRGNMMWGYGFGWGGMFVMTLGMVFWIALLVVLVWAVIQWLDRRTNHPGSLGTGMPLNQLSAQDILRQRYARGEIDTATFEQMRERLEASASRESQPR